MRSALRWLGVLMVLRVWPVWAAPSGNITASDNHCPIVGSSAGDVGVQVSHWDAIDGAIPIIDMEHGGAHVRFFDATEMFLGKIREVVEHNCATGKAHGIVNLRLEHSVDKDFYYYIATFDWIR